MFELTIGPSPITQPYHGSTATNPTALPLKRVPKLLWGRALQLGFCRAGQAFILQELVIFWAQFEALVIPYKAFYGLCPGYLKDRWGILHGYFRLQSMGSEEAGLGGTIEKGFSAMLVLHQA